MARTVPAGEFKAKCLKLLDEVKQSGKTVVVTKRGEPVAELRPVARHRKPLIGFYKGKVKILGDIISPIEDIEREAMKD